MPGEAHWHPWPEPRTPAELSDEQRDQLVAYFEANKGCGYKAAFKSIGVHGTRAELKQLLGQYEELRDIRLKQYHLDRHSILTAAGEIITDPGHKDRARMVEWAGNVYHGLVPAKQVEHSGEMTSTHQVAVSVEHDFKAIADTLEAAGVIRRGPVALRAAPEPVLPARADAEADGGAGRAPLAS